MSLRYERIVLCASSLALLGAVACSDDDPVNGLVPENHAPTIDFTLPFAVPRSAPAAPVVVTLGVGVKDADGDAVRVFWEITRNGEPSGVLEEAQQGQPSIEWETPVAVGCDSVYVTATDGEDSTVVKETIRVGTVKAIETVSTVETWTGAESPFIVTSDDIDFVINVGKTLRVEAGSEIYIDKPRLVITVCGTLKMNGTAGAPVVMRPNWRAAKAGGWQGIAATTVFFEEGDPLVELAYTHLMYAAIGVQGNKTAVVRLNGCRITHSKDAAVLHASEGELRVENSFIVDNLSSGVKVRKLDDPLPTHIELVGNYVTSNGDVTGETPYTDEAAIYIAIPDVGADASISITGNQIFSNGVPGIHLTSACYPLINGNSIYANEIGKAGTRYNIKLEKEFGVGGAQDTLDATMNYWGGIYPPATGDSLIKDMIYDAEDHGSIAVRVVINPWKNAWP